MIKNTSDLKTFKPLALSNDILHKIAAPVNFDSPEENIYLASSMMDFMTKSNGIGLAAPQVGINKRLFVMKINHMHHFCFNPEIIKASDTLISRDEGCLSFPGERLSISRPDCVEVKFQTGVGEWIFSNYFGIYATCFQHELDHLDGIVMHHRLNTLYHPIDPLNITLNEGNNHLVMQIREKFLDTSTWSSVGPGLRNSWQVELNCRDGVKQVGNSTWHWDIRFKQQAEEYVTYFNLKYS